ncbi:MAG: lectin like domain-containing protein, partial [Methanoregula sp.]|nr:lectin like domain-containing protein [Methanoregula sp.]
MDSRHHTSTTTGFILAVLVIGTLFFGMCASAAVNASLSENSTNLSVPGNPAGLSPEPANISELHDEDVLGAGIPAGMAPVNPDLLQYLQDQQEKQKMLATNIAVAETTEDQRHGLGYVPPPVSMSYLKGPFIVQDTGSSTSYSMSVPTTEAAPSLYDLRTTGKLTSVKNQLTSGTCWAFATYGALESYLLPGETWDFSENNMKNLLSKDYPEGYDRISEGGGNSWKSTAYLSRWSGPISEADDPFNPSSSLSPTDKTVREHVQNVYFVPDRTSSTDNTNIQNAIQTYGGVATSMRWEDSSSYWNEATNSYYYTGSGTSNHAVTIVGWNDTYDKSKFSIVPPGNGAFIIKNSWGVPWGENGYFYISYYDTKIGKDNTVFTAESPTNYNYIYQYDPLGMVTQYWIGSLKTGWMTNVFTSTRTETLSAVSFYTTDTNTAYQVYVHKNPNSGPVLNSSGAAWSGSGTFGNAGYHTVTVSPGISLTSGNKFSVVVKLTNPTYDYWAATEYYSTLPVYNSSKATASTGQSYYSTGGTSWTDLTTVLQKSNFCIKAFTNDAGSTVSKIGVFRPSTHLYYRDFNGNGLWDGAVVDRVSTFGITGDLPVSGDWNNDGISEIGVFRPSTHLYYRDFSGNGLWDGA